MIKTIKDFDLKGKRVLMRVDFNLPLDEKGNILDDFRLKETIPTIEFALKKRAKLILATHLGRPQGKVISKLKLDKIQERLTEYLDLSVVKTPVCIGKEVERWTHQMAEGEVLLLENLRFYKEEEENDLNFAKKLAKLGDLFINEAFSSSHRGHASLVSIPKFLPSGIGLLFEKELKNLDKIIKNPQRPLVAIVGGKKVKDKAPLIEKLSQIGDFILIGWLIKNEIEKEKLKFSHPQKIISPKDGETEKGKYLDIGKRTISEFEKIIKKAKTIFWNGPLGKIEEKKFQKGSLKIAKAIEKSKAFSVVGGGETVEFLNSLNLLSSFSHVSTGGGAMLFYLARDNLPALSAIEKCTRF